MVKKEQLNPCATSTIVRGASQHITIQNTQKGYLYAIRGILLF